MNQRLSPDRYSFDFAWVSSALKTIGLDKTCTPPYTKDQVLAALIAALKNQLTPYAKLPERNFIALCEYYGITSDEVKSGLFPRTDDQLAEKSTDLAVLAMLSEIQRRAFIEIMLDTPPENCANA